MGHQLLAFATLRRALVRDASQLLPAACVSLSNKLYCRGLHYNALKKAHGGDRRSQDPSGQPDHLKTADALAEQYAVSPKTIRRDGAFARDVDTIARSCGPEVKQAILAKDAAITATEVKQIAAMDPEDRQAAVGARLTKSKEKRPAPRECQARPKFITIPAAPPAAALVIVRRLGVEDAGKLHGALGDLLQAIAQPTPMAKAKTTP